MNNKLDTMQSKFRGTYLCAKHARINPSGSIILFSGILSRRPGMNDVVLASVDAAVEAMGRALAKDLAPNQGQRNLSGHDRRYRRLSENS